MDNTRQSETLEMRWLPVADEAGRTHMEATWILVPSDQGTASTAVVHAA